MLDSAVVDQLARKVQRYGKRGLNEQNTKSALIEPLLEALGWDLRDIDEVEREYSYRDGRGSYRIDYALRTEPRKLPALLVEAKALGEDLDDMRWRRQVIHYANDCNVAWAVLTDGDRYLVFKADAQAPVDQRLFREVNVSQDDQREVAVDILRLLSKSALTEAEINRRWDAWRITVTGRDALRRLVSEKDPALVRLLAKKTSLTKGEVERFLEAERDTLFEGAPAPEVKPPEIHAPAQRRTRTRRSRTADALDESMRGTPNTLRTQARARAPAGRSAEGSPRGRRAGSQAEALGLPPQGEVHVHLLDALAARGGRVKPSDKVDGKTLYDELADLFRLSPEARAAILPSGRGVNAWCNRVQWARQALVTSGHIDGAERGIWKLTPKGRRAVASRRHEQPDQ